MSTYTDSQDIVFLNDKNIVHNISDDKTNAIASQSLASSLSNTVSSTYVSAANATMDDATANKLSAKDLTAVDASLSDAVVGNIAATNGVMTSCDISTLNVNSLSSDGTIQANALNITGDASTGNVNVANINATNQISVGGDAFVANSNGNVTAKKLTAETLSIQTSLTVDNSITANNSGLTTNNILSGNALVAKTRIVLNNILTADTNGIKSTADISAKSLSTDDITAANITATTANATTANISTANATTANLTNITATQTNTGTLIVQNSCVVASKLSADSNGLSIDGNLSVNADVRAGNISAATISATDQIIVDGKLTATNGGLTANGNLSTNNDLDVAGNLSVGNTSLSAKGLSADNDGIKTPSLSATNISAITLSAASAVFSPNGIRIGDDSTTNKLLIDNTELNIVVPLDGGNPKLNINGKRFADYYKGYLSDGYLDDVKIEKPNSGDYIGISCLKFTWNDDSDKADKLIPLSALGGIYDVADGDTIIKIVKTNANSFKVSADETAISSLIKDALSAEFGIQGTKDELSNKILFQNGTTAQKVDSMTIHKMSLTQYKGMSPDQRVSSDIYVIEDDNIDAFDGKIINLAEPTLSTDAATKNYVDGKIATLRTDAETFAGDALNSAKDYTNQVRTSLNTSIEEKIQYKADPTSQPENISNLTIQKITAASYRALTDAEKNRKDVIYSITGDDYNMFGNKIVALAGPNDPTDAANKAYVDTTVDAAKVALSGSLSFADDSDNSKMLLKLGEQQIAYFDYSPFIKDGMLEKVEVSSDSSTNIDVLVFTFNTDNQPRIITVPLTSLAEVYSNGTYTTITPDGGPSHNTSIIDVNITAIQNAIDSSIRSNIVEDNLSVLNKHNSTIGTWNAPAANSPLAQLSGAISSVIKADVISEDNRISTSLSSTISSTYVSSDELTAYVSKDALSDGDSSYISTLMNNYYTAQLAFLLQLLIIMFHQVL